ncbi:MAG: peptidylprolyl isomerase [Campylobacterota bacterium]|nr:peptidylprolyl isomerase [Campylobacterota bacterium]
MMTWMQKRKNWLIPTIWISTIAFVGAGFVGWGSYDFGKSQGAVAQVGEKEVKFSALQDEYNNIYNQYSQMFGTEFNQEMAEKFKLQDVALDAIIQKYLLLNYAEELGIGATKKDIAKELVQMPAFIVDGRFDKNTYIKVLAQNRTTPTDFEERIKQDVILRKVQSLFTATSSQKELATLSKLFLLEDELKIQIIDGDTLNPQTTEDQVKQYWEKNSNNYMSEPSYELQTFATSIDNTMMHSDKDIEEHYTVNKFDYLKEDGKIQTLEEAKEKINFDLNAKLSKKTALKSYLKLKKDKQKFETTLTLFESKLPYAQEDIKNIQEAKTGTVLKPFVHNKEYITIKVIKQIKPQALSYEKAKSLANEDLLNTLKTSALQDEAKKQLENFQGKNIGFVSTQSAGKIDGLTPPQAQQFLTKLFTMTTKKDIIIIENKAIIYEILQSRLGNEDLAKENSIKTSIENLKNNEIMKSLLEKLRMQYEVYSYKDQGK